MPDHDVSLYWSGENSIVQVSFFRLHFLCSIVTSKKYYPSESHYQRQNDWNRKGWSKNIIGWSSDLQISLEESRIGSWWFLINRHVIFSSISGWRFFNQPAMFLFLLLTIESSVDIFDQPTMFSFW